MTQVHILYEDEFVIGEPVIKAVSLDLDKLTKLKAEYEEALSAQSKLFYDSYELEMKCEREITDLYPEWNIMDAEDFNIIWNDKMASLREEERELLKAPKPRDIFYSIVSKELI